MLEIVAYFIKLRLFSKEPLTKFTRPEITTFNFELNLATE